MTDIPPEPIEEEPIVPTPEEVEAGGFVDRSQQAGSGRTPDRSAGSPKRRKGLISRIRSGVGRDRTEVRPPRPAVEPVPGDALRVGESGSVTGRDEEPIPVQRPAVEDEILHEDRGRPSSESRVPSWSFDEELPEETDEPQEPPTTAPSAPPGAPPTVPPASPPMGSEPMEPEEEGAESPGDEPSEVSESGAKPIRRIGFDRVKPEPPIRKVPIERLKGTEYVAAKAAELGHDLGRFERKTNPEVRLMAYCRTCGKMAGVCYQVEEGWSPKSAVENYIGDALRARCNPDRPGEDDSSEEDPPAGVREPRRPRPDADSGSAWLMPFLNSKVGGDPIQTLGTAQPNWITGVDDESIWVETLKSRREGSGPQAIPLAWVRRALDTLLETGGLTRDDLDKQQRHRSAFIFALLANVPGTESRTGPIRLYLRSLDGKSAGRPQMGV